MSEEITKEDLLNMKLHEKKELDPSKTILRVFGGWIYYDYSGGPHPEPVTAVFVPDVINVEAHVTNHY